MEKYLLEEHKRKSIVEDIYSVLKRKSSSFARSSQN